MNRDQKPTHKPAAQPGSQPGNRPQSDDDYAENRQRDSGDQFSQQSDRLQQPGGSPDRAERGDGMREDSDVDRNEKARK
jgi:hypothetical protein